MCIYITFKISVPASQKTKLISITKINQLPLYKDTAALFIARTEENREGLNSERYSKWYK
jgi:hypothetical protein